MINVLLADDHAIVRQGVKSILNATADINVIGEAANGAEVLQLLKSGIDADVILADVMMPGMSGLEMIEHIKKDYPAVAILMLTVKDDEDFFSRAFKTGVAGYLTKAVEHDELLFAIRRVSERKRYLGTSITNHLVEKLVKPEQRAQSLKLKNMDLNEREMEMLKMIADGFTNQEVADKMFTSKRTIEGYRQNLLTKTQTNNAAHLVCFAMRAGIIN